ncbi:MAG: Cof-type HAD-IIB family hydrolase [Fusobacteriaceae bacterium]
MENNYKIVVSDMDDTLLNSSGKISEENRKIIIEAQKKGVKIILASGRPIFAMREASKELQLDKYDGYLIAFNGGIITSCKNNEEIFTLALSKEEIHELYDFSKRNKVHIVTYSSDEIISETNSKYIDIEIGLTGMKHRKVDCFKSNIQSSGVKCIMLEEPEYLKSVEKKLKDEMGDRYSIAISKPFFLEITKKGIDKGTTLLKLAKKLQIKQEEIICIGDSFNDVSMLKIAGLSAAVSNGREEIKGIVDFITTSNDENGVAEVIKKYILKK